MTKTAWVLCCMALTAACTQAYEEKDTGGIELHTKSSKLVESAGDMWAMGPAPGMDQEYPKGFNLFVFNNLTNSIHIQGAAAAGGNVSSQYFAINDGSHKSAGLVAKGDVSLNSGTVVGDLYYGGSATIPQNVHVTGDVVNSSPIDFADARSRLLTMSYLLTEYAANGTTTVYSWGGVHFEGSDSTLNVFEVEASALNAADSISFQAPSGSVVLINVKGSAVNMSNMGISLSGPSKNNVLWNFSEASSISLSSLSFQGSALAPLADVTAKWGNFEGTLVAKSFSGTMEFHDFPFNGNIRLTISQYMLVSPGGPLEDNPWEDSDNYLVIGEQNVRFYWNPKADAASYNLVVLVPSSQYSVFYQEVCTVEDLSVGNGLQEENGLVYYEFTDDDCPTRDILNNYWPGVPEHAWYVETVAGNGDISTSEWFRYYLECADTLNVPSEYPTIQQAVDAAGNGACIVIADGVYTGAENKNIHWNGLEKHLWIRSENGPTNCTIDVEGDGRGFDMSDGQTRQDIIQGLTIRNGWAKLPIDQPGPDYDLRGGGAVRCDGTSPQILDNIMTNNIAGDTEGRVTVSFLADGGAIYVGNGGNPIIRGNTMDGNYASHTGGGIGINSASASIENNFIINNMNRGCYGGGGISLATAASDSGLPLTEIANNVIAGNSTEYYAVYPTICSGGYGGGIITLNSDPSIVNNTIVNNTTALRDPDACANPDKKPLGEGGGIRVRGKPYPFIANNIIRDNISTAGLESLDFQYPTDTLDVSYSDIEGGVAGINVTMPETIIDVDPSFVDAASGNYDLLSMSQCIDMGTPDWPDTMRYYDLAGRPRSRGDAIDIGAYEFFQ